MSVEQHDRHAVSVFVGEPGVVGVYDLEVPALTIHSIRDERQGHCAKAAGATGQEADRRHQVSRRRVLEDTSRPSSGIVGRLMRPATVLAIILLLLILTVAGVVFVIQLLSVT